MVSALAETTVNSISESHKKAMSKADFFTISSTLLILFTLQTYLKQVLLKYNFLVTLASGALHEYRLPWPMGMVWPLSCYTVVLIFYGCQFCLSSILFLNNTILWHKIKPSPMMHIFYLWA